jgi:hypothetical protein
MFVHIIFIQRAYIGTYCHREVSSESALQAWPIFSKKYVCAGPANTFGGKNLVKNSADLHPRQNNLLHTKEHFYRTQQNLSLQHRIVWRPAEKNLPFFQHASSIKISMICTVTYVTFWVIFPKHIWSHWRNR